MGDERAGMDVEVRNQAVGGREPCAASLCGSTLAGDDADLVIREWEYWDWNDGLPDGHGVNSEAGLEVFVRRGAGEGGLQLECLAIICFRGRHLSLARTRRETSTRPKMSRNEWKLTFERRRL